jgi:Flp pilus assembly protein TadD
MKKICLFSGVLLAAAGLHAEPKMPPKAKSQRAPDSAAPGLSYKESAPKLTDSQQVAQGMYAEGIAKLEKGEIPAAQELFNKVLEISPDNVPAIINVGLLEQRQHNYPEAERRFKQAIHEQGENGLPWMLLGIVSYEQGKLEAATAHLAQAALYSPSSAQVFNYLGATISRRGWYSGAEEQLRKAIELDPKYAEAHYNLAALYLERVPPALELARRHYEKSLELGGAPDAEMAKHFSDHP